MRRSRTADLPTARAIDPYEEAPHFLIHDRDGIYGDYFKKRVKDMGEEVLIANRSPKRIRLRRTWAQ